MRQVVWVHLDKPRYGIVLTPPPKAGKMRNVTVIPITSTIIGLNTEISVGPEEGCDYDCAANCDNITTVAVGRVQRTVGAFFREDELRAAVLAALNL